MNYKISVIIPVYNVEKFLDKCFQSLINQTLEEIEFIAVNDCSTDNSLQILQSYKSILGEKLQIINSPINVKQGGARNLGIAAATGEYIAFVDPDDYLELEALQKLYEVGKRDDADIVTCDYFELKNNIKQKKNNDLPTGVLTTEKRKKALTRKYGWELWQQIYKRDLFIKNNIYFGENLYVTDLEIGGLIYILANKVSKVDEPLYYYLKHDNATTTFKINDNKVFDLIKVNNLRLEHFKSRNLYEEYKEELDYIYFWHIGIVSTYRCVINFSEVKYDELKSLKSMLEKNTSSIQQNIYYQKEKLAIKLYYNLFAKFPKLYTTTLKLAKVLPIDRINELKNKIKK